MRVKIEEILLAADVLRQLYTQKLTGEAAYKLYKIIKWAESELTAFDETRNALVRSLGVQSSDSEDTYRFDSEESRKEFEEELEKLLAMEVELGIVRLSPSDLNSAELSPSQIAEIWWVLE